MIIGSFMSGAVLGAAGFSVFHYRVLYFPAAIVGLVGAAYAIYRRHEHAR